MVINASSEPPYPLPEGIRYVQFELLDEDKAPIETYFGTLSSLCCLRLYLSSESLIFLEPAFAVFNQALAGNERVLVHWSAISVLSNPPFTS